MAQIRTKPTKLSVIAFVSSIQDRDKRADVKIVTAMMRRATGNRPRLWGTS